MLRDRPRTRLLAVCVCGALLLGCERFTPTSAPQPRSEVRLRFSEPRDLWSVSEGSDSIPLRSVRHLQARVASVHGDTLVLIAPGDYTGARGNFLLNSGRSVTVVRDRSIIMDLVSRSVVEAGLVSLVIASIAAAVYFWISPLWSWG